MNYDYMNNYLIKHSFYLSMTPYIILFENEISADL